MTKAKSYKSAKDFRVALERRLQKHAADSGLNLQRLLAGAATADLGDFFGFEIGGVQMELDGPIYGGERYLVRAIVDDRLFVSFHVDVAVGDFIPEKLETAYEQGLLSFAGIKPAAFPLLPKEVQFAEKLHSYTMPRSVPNSRVRDLVDMVLLIKEGSLSTAKTKDALRSVFDRRKSHPVPAALAPAPAAWGKRFSEMAGDCGLKADLEAGFDILNRFYLKSV